MDYYFVLNGYLNGEEGEIATVAGDGGPHAPVQRDGWYYLPSRVANGVGPFVSKRAAQEAAARTRRYYLFPLNGDTPVEIAEEDDGGELDGNVVIAHPADERGVRRIECACFYDDRGVFELRTTLPLEQALDVFQFAMEREAQLESGGSPLVGRASIRRN